MTDKSEYDVEVLGTCMTNPTRNTEHAAPVAGRYLWSYAQEEALIAMSEKRGGGCHSLITDPERRAKRIAARYADLYFKSAAKSKGKVQFYWVALAAFVVKDIVEAFRFAREEVLHNEWTDSASVARNSSMAELVSLMKSSDSPFQHALRTYAALAKGNLWLFMDIYPWMWFFLEYGIKNDGTVNEALMNQSLGERDWATFQDQSKKAVEELPFGPNWLGRLGNRLAADPVYKEAKSYFDQPPSWAANGGYGSLKAAEFSANAYVKKNVQSHDSGYRMPSSHYWGRFKQAFHVMESEHRELMRLVKDVSATAELTAVRSFKVTAQMRAAYSAVMKQAGSPTRAEKKRFQRDELIEIAKHEQLNVLQRLIYGDKELIETMDMNHRFSRLTGGWVSPQFKLVFSAAPQQKTRPWRLFLTPLRVFGIRHLGIARACQIPKTE